MIAIDLRMMRSSGIGTYVRNVIPGIVGELSGRYDLCILCPEEWVSREDWASGSKVKVVDFKDPIYSVREQVSLSRLIPRGTRLFWSPHYNIPLLYRGRLLVTVHDVCHLAMPEFVKGIEKRFYAKFMFHRVGRKADAIICNSSFTAGELEKYAGVKADKISVIHMGTGPPGSSARGIDSAPHPRSYLLHVGNVKPNKNISTLIKAYSSIRGEIPHDLVIVGRKEGFITGDPDTLSLAGTIPDRVHFTGYMPDDELGRYYRHAAALIMPSLYEGFGLPPLEAMAHGCPTAVARCSSLPEICGDASVYFDPRSVDGMAGSIKEIVSNEDLRGELIRKGRERVKSFTWERCIERTKELIVRLARN